MDLKKKIRIVKKLAFRTVSILIVLFLFGFFLFATYVTRTTRNSFNKADAIVVLTGGTERIAAAAKLLSSGHAKWLLISGVNKNTSKIDILRLSKLRYNLFNCCVVLGYFAQDTKGNALEARAWQHENEFKSLIVVTAAYHMPRSLIELSLQMPDVKLIPYSVMPKRFRTQIWWLSSSNVYFLAREYVKFLPSAARFITSKFHKTSTGL
ncbi:MAG: hypothetical protein TECD_00861 [Hyphomicrobiaceae bacterium hypho_1]